MTLKIIGVLKTVSNFTTGLIDMTENYTYIEKEQTFDLQCPDVYELSTTILDKAKDIIVCDDETFEIANKLAESCQTAIKRIEAQHKLVKAPYLQACQAIDAEKKRLMANFEEAKRIAMEGAYSYKMAKEARLAKEREEARKAAEEEQKRLQEEMAKKAAEAETATTEEERLYKEAEIVKLQNEAASTAPVVPIIKKPKGGPSVRESFVGTVTDKVKFLKFVAQHIDDNPEFIDFLEVKQTKINNYIKMTKGLKALDGVEITKGVTLVTRSRK